LVLSDFKDFSVTAEIQKTQPGIVVAIGNGALFNVKAIRDIPIIYLMVLNPRRMLGGEENITGLTIQIPPEKQLGVFREALPDMRKIGLLFDPSKTRPFVERALLMARKVGLKLIPREVHDTREVPSLVNSLKGEIDAFWMLPDPTVVCSETVEFILLFSIENRVPIFTFSDKYVEMGATMSMSIDAFDLGRQAGEMAQKILAGAAIRDIPEVEPRKIVISVNVKVAGKLGLSLSDKIIGEAKIIK